MTKSHIILIVLLIGVLVGSVYLMFSYQGAEAKQPDIQNEITMALMRLETAKNEKNPEPLKQQLAKLQSELDLLTRDKPLFPEKPATVEIGDLIVDSAEKLNLTLLKLSPKPEAGTVTIKSDKESQDKQSKGNKYSKAEYDVKVKGDLGRVNSFIGEIEGADFATLTIEDLEIEFKEKEEENINWWEVEFTVVTLYQYEDNK